MNKSMHRLINVLLMCILLSVGAFAQTRPITPAVSAQSKVGVLDSSIAAIRAAYTRINTMSLKPEPFKFESSGCVEDGEVTYFRSGNDILKVSYSGGIGDGSWTTDFYFTAGKLIFCYDKLTGGPAAGQATTTEYRLYVKADKAIRCMENKKVVQPDSKATETINTANKLLKAYRIKNFTAALCD